MVHRPPPTKFGPAASTQPKAIAAPATVRHLPPPVSFPRPLAAPRPSGPAVAQRVVAAVRQRADDDDAFIRQVAGHMIAPNRVIMRDEADDTTLYMMIFVGQNRQIHCHIAADGEIIAAHVKSSGAGTNINGHPTRNPVNVVDAQMIFDWVNDTLLPANLVTLEQL